METKSLHHRKNTLFDRCLKGYISMKLVFSPLVKMYNQPLVKKVKSMFQTKKYNKTCSKLVINELGRCPDISFNVNFANNEQASLSVFYCCVLFCTCQTKFNQTFLIKLNYFIIDQRKLLTIFRRVQCEIQANQSNLLTFQN